MQHKQLFLLFSLFHILKSVANGPDINTVDHKDSQLNLYLDLIKYNTQEKIGILPYILAKPKGTYLEIGTGGDPIGDMLSKIPDTSESKIIASDIDQAILDSLPQRHPHLQKYIHALNGPKLELKRLDATNMSCFENNSLAGINASAVVHEIISYAGGLPGFETFIKESFRTLEQGGVLVYRDPESVTKKQELVTVYFKNPSIRLFAHIFIPKFLDTKYGKMAHSGRKSEKYDPTTLTITCYKENESFPAEYSYDEYFHIRSYEIDFSRGYSIKMPRGLCREIERHYLTYLHQCNPLMYVKCIPSIDSELYLLNYLAHSTCGILDAFLLKKNLKKEDINVVSINIKQILDSFIKNQAKAIEYGIPLHIESKYRYNNLIALLKQHNFEPNLYLIPIKDNDFLLDYRIFGLLYDYIEDTVFDDKNKAIHNHDTVHAKWLKREGEETYIYYSDDELITNVLKICLNIETNTQKLVLCPLSAEHNKFIPRLCYDEVLKISLDISDMAGYPIEIKEGKRIIHFAKLPMADALIVYNKLVNCDPEHYEKLKSFLSTLNS